MCGMAAIFELMFVLLFILHSGVYSAGKDVFTNGDILDF
ncbi:putative membrane protein [Anaplasma phagocytophilum str. CRT53-1]|uniref:Putative membrane protein n=1 Tax=Anaplasma phagocytophilum str. CRT53-1 TaxID=1359157 RepID=A0A0F3Q0P4_ANAPH|nr:putative membrane protein [Anaplasma phagocytophilum str. CRT53-1]